MKDIHTIRIEREREDLLNKISDSSLKERLIELKKVFADTQENPYRSDTIPRLPRFYRKEFLDIFSKKNPSILNYLLANTDYLYEFMDNLRLLDQVFEAICELDILDIYLQFTNFPNEFVKYFIDNFGRMHSHIINDSITLNIDYFYDSHNRLNWIINIYVCGRLVEEVSTFYIPNSNKREVIKDSINLAKSLDKWVNDGYPPKLLNRSIAIPILKEMQANEVPGANQAISEYNKPNKELVKITPEQLVNKKITVYQGTVTSIINREQKKLDSGVYKGITYQREEVRIILKNAMIIPSIKKPHELYREDVELEVDELEIVTFEKLPIKIGDFLYCYGEIEMRPEYGPYRFVYYLSTIISGHVDIKK